MKTNEDIKHKRAEQKRAYRKTHQTINLSFLNEEAGEIGKKAKEKGMDIPRYLKALVKADLDGKNVVLSVEQEKNISELILEIRKVGNNINQIIRGIHTSKSVTFEDISSLRGRLVEMEQSIITILNSGFQRKE